MAKKDSEGESTVVASKTVKLKNATRQALVFNLPHAEYCADGPCACQQVTRTIEDYDYKNKEHVTKVVDALICSSVTWLVGESLDVPYRVESVKHIYEALQRRHLVKL